MSYFEELKKRADSLHSKKCEEIIAKHKDEIKEMLDTPSIETSLIICEDGSTEMLRGSKYAIAQMKTEEVCPSGRKGDVHTHILEEYPFHEIWRTFSEADIESAKRVNNDFTCTIRSYYTEYPRDVVHDLSCMEMKPKFDDYHSRCSLKFRKEEL